MGRMIEPEIVTLVNMRDKPGVNKFVSIANNYTLKGLVKHLLYQFKDCQGDILIYKHDTNRQFPYCPTLSIKYCKGELLYKYSSFHMFDGYRIEEVRYDSYFDKDRNGYYDDFRIVMTNKYK